MSDKTPFAGLEVLAPGEPLSTDSYQFQSIDRYVIDRILRVGAVTHRHDAHAALANPTAAPVVAIASGGAIPSGQTMYVTYTLVDADGGESLAVTVVTITTAGGFATPVLAPTAVVDYTAGSLLADNYSYGVTVTDGHGGETPISPAAQVTILSGFANGRVTISGLAAILAASSGGASGAAWRLWRMQGGGPWYLIDTGTAATSVDTGAPGDCTVAPPDASTISGTNALHVTVPSAGQPAGAVGFNIYAALSGSLPSPSLLAALPIAQFDHVQSFTDLLVTTGRPPTVSTCLPGANLITADDLALTWLPPVASVGALPTTGNHDGDARVALDGPTIQVWIGSAWTEIGGGGGGGGGGGADTTSIGAVRSVGPTEVAIAANATTHVTIPAPTSLAGMVTWRLVIAVSITHTGNDGLSLSVGDGESNCTLFSTGAAASGLALGSKPAWEGAAALGDMWNYVFFTDMAKGFLTPATDTYVPNEPIQNISGSPYTGTGSSPPFYRPEQSLARLSGDDIGDLTLSIHETAGNPGTLHGVMAWWVTHAWDAIAPMPPPRSAYQSGPSPTSDYTVLPTDQGKVIIMQNTTDATVSIPASVMQIGSSFKILRLGTGAVTVAATGGTVVGPGSLGIAHQNGVALLELIGSDYWVASGDVA